MRIIAQLRDWLEPAYVRHLPPRFQARWYANWWIIICVIAIFAVPRRVGPYGEPAFFSIVWVMYVGMTLLLFIGARPWPRRRAFVLVGLTAAAFMPAIVEGWTTRGIEGLAALGVFCGCILYPVMAIAYRRITLSFIFDRSPVSYRDAVRQAKAQAGIVRPEDLMRP